MQSGCRSQKLTLVLSFTTLCLVRSVPQILNPRDDVCDSEDSIGTVEDNDGDTSYACPSSSKRLLVRDIVGIPSKPPTEKREYSNITESHQAKDLMHRLERLRRPRACESTLQELRQDQESQR